MSQDQALTRLETLIEHYKEFCSNHDRILTLDEFDAAHAYISSGLADIVEESYLDIKATYKTFLDRFNVAVQPVPNPQGRQGQQLKSLPFEKSLPRIEVPSFSGSFEQWTHWRDLYKNMIHKREEIPPIFKFYYLNTYLKDDALSKIENIAVTAENYERAWNTIEQFYENKRRITNHLVGSLLSIKSMKVESFAELKRLRKSTFDILAALEKIDRSVETTGVDLVIALTVSRFEPATRKEWEKLIGNSSNPPTLDQLQKFLEKQESAQEAIEKSSRVSYGSQPKAEIKAHTTTKSAKSKGPLQCPFCKESHFLNQCIGFKNKSVTERDKFVCGKKLCRQCLGPNCRETCIRQFMCRKCNKPHHHLLHVNNADCASNTTVKIEECESETESNATISSAIIQPTTSLNATIGQKFVFLSTAMVRVRLPNGAYVQVKALVDQCSQSSFISEALSQRLKLKRSGTNVKVNGVGDLAPCSSKGLVQFSITSRFDSKNTLLVSALILPKVSGYRVEKFAGSTEWLHLKGLQLADPNYLKPGEIDLLLGSEVHSRIVKGSVRKGDINEPIATDTELGWIISGPSGSGSSKPSTFIHCVDNTQLFELLNKFWKVEEPTTTKYLSPEDKYVEEHFVKTHSRNESGRYIVRLPLKEDVLESLGFNLGGSYVTALKTLHSMERKFDKDAGFKEKYVEFMKLYEDSGEMTRLSDLSESDKDKSYFLPHHGVLQGSKKLRTVFNGSAKVNGVSLNDLLYPGPCLVPELFDLLMKWRSFKFVFITDILRMFRQFLVDLRDRHYQLILWRYNKSDPISCYRLNTVTYGLSSAPFLANRCLRQLAYDYADVFPLASKIILYESYVDDFMSGGDTVDETLEKQVQLRGLLKVGGLELRKWAANLPCLEDWLPESERLRGSSTFESHESTSILGLTWSPEGRRFPF